RRIEAAVPQPPRLIAAQSETAPRLIDRFLAVKPDPKEARVPEPDHTSVDEPTYSWMLVKPDWPPVFVHRIIDVAMAGYIAPSRPAAGAAPIPPLEAYTSPPVLLAPAPTLLFQILPRRFNVNPRPAESIDLLRFAPSLELPVFGSPELPIY